MPPVEESALVQPSPHSVADRFLAACVPEASGDPAVAIVGTLQASYARQATARVAARHFQAASDDETLYVAEWSWAGYPKVKIKDWDGKMHHIDIPTKLLLPLRALRDKLGDLRMEEEMAIDQGYEGGLHTNLRSIQRDIASTEKDLERAEDKLIPKILAKMGHSVDATTYRSRFARTHHSASTAKTAGEVRFIKDKGSDHSEWGWGTPGPSEREIDPGFEFKPKYLKPLAETMRSALMALGHATSAHSRFVKIKSRNISPDGALGGKGYIQKIPEMRRQLMNCVEVLSALTDTLYDELQAPHWDTSTGGGGNREREQVEQIMEDAEGIKDDPEGWAEEEEDDLDVEHGKTARSKTATRCTWEDPCIRPDGRVEAYGKIYSTDDIDQFVADLRLLVDLPRRLTRHEYERWARKVGVKAHQDSDLGGYADRYGDYSLGLYFATTRNRKSGWEMTLRQRRWWTLLDEAGNRRATGASRVATHYLPRGSP